MSKTSLAAFAALTMTVAAPVLATDARTDDWNFSVSYTCERGARIDVVYINSPEGASYAVADFDGRLVPLQIVQSGSGAKYTEGEDGLVIWNSGDELSVYYGADETALFQGCSSDSED